MLYDRLVLRPLRRLYLQGPSYLGFWGGQALADGASDPMDQAFIVERLERGAHRLDLTPMRERLAARLEQIG